MKQIEKAEEAWNLVSRFYDTVSHHESYHKGVELEVGALSLELGVSLLGPMDEPPTGICILLELLAEAEVIDYPLFRDMCQTIEREFPSFVGRHVWRQTPEGARGRALWAKMQATKASYQLQ